MSHRVARIDGYQPWPMQANGLYPAVDLDFRNGRYIQADVYDTAANLLSITRTTSGATDLLPTSASGATITTFAAGTLRLTTGGLLVEASRVNRLLNSTAPATQTTASLATGTYTLWVNGTGTATSSAGTATATGYGVASQGSPNTIVVTGTGTVVVTVAGSLNAFQLELGTFGTSLIVTAGTVVTRNADVITLTTFPTFGPLLTLFAEGTPYADAGAVQVLLSVDDGTLNNRIQLARNSSTSFGLVNIVTATSTLWNGSGTVAWAQAKAQKLAVAAMNGNNEFKYTDSPAIFLATAGALPTTTTVHLGCRADGAVPFNGIIHRAAIWPTMRLSSTELIRITT